MFVLETDRELPPLLSDTELEFLTLEWDDLLGVEDAAGGEDSGWLPAGVEEWPPGVFLAAVVSVADSERLSGFDLVRLLRAVQRLRSHYDARLYESMAALHVQEPESEHPDEDHAQTSSEIAAALSWTRRAADTSLTLALELVSEARIWKQLVEGRIDYRKARILLTGLAPLDAQTREQVLEQVLPTAERLTTGQLHHRLARQVIEADPKAAQTRYHQAVEERRLWKTLNPDGSSQLGGANLPTPQVEAAHHRIHHLALQMSSEQRAGRSLDQVKADLYLNLLCGKPIPTTSSGEADKGSSSRNSGGVQVTVTLETLAGLADHPGDLNATTPLVAEITRKTIAQQQNGAWTYTVTHNGTPISTGTLTRRATNGIKAHLQAAYPTCIFPGCRQPHTNSDLDHTQPWKDHGPTSLTNLAPLCHRPSVGNLNLPGFHTGSIV